MLANAMEQVEVAEGEHLITQGANIIFLSCLNTACVLWGRVLCVDGVCYTVQCSTAFCREGKGREGKGDLECLRLSFPVLVLYYPPLLLNSPFCVLSAFCRSLIILNSSD